MLHPEGGVIALCNTQALLCTPNPDKSVDEPDQESEKQDRADKLADKGNDDKKDVRHGLLFEGLLFLSPEGFAKTDALSFFSCT